MNSLVCLFCFCVVLRPHQRAGIWLHYPEGQRAEGRWPPYKLQAQGLVDIKTAVLGHTHPRGALWVLWSSCCPWGGVTSYITQAAVSHRKGCVATGGCSWLGQLQMSQVRTMRCIKMSTFPFLCFIGTSHAKRYICFNYTIWSSLVLSSMSSYFLFSM